MRRVHEAMRLSPQQVDPLSWVSGPLIGAGFTTLLAIYGSLQVILMWTASQRPWLDALAVLMLVGASALITRRTDPLRRDAGPIAIAFPLIVAGAGLALSAISHVSSTVPVQLWWAPVCVGLLIAASVPASTARQIVFYGVIFTVQTGVSAFFAFGGRNDPWSELSTVIIACSMIMSGALAAAVFSLGVVYSTQSLLVGAGHPEDESTATQEQTAREVHLRTLARLGSRVAPFLAAIAESGEVTREDRALAGQLARRLRSDLVSRANESWLDQVASAGRMFIVDPDHRANRMNSSQRTALRGLLQAVLAEPAADARSLFVELRGQPDGSTAVAISLDLDLPEGRRVTMLAPYYVTLKATVPDISWDRGRDLLRFKVPAERKR